MSNLLASTHLRTFLRFYSGKLAFSTEGRDFSENSYFLFLQPLLLLKTIKVIDLNEKPLTTVQSKTSKSRWRLIPFPIYGDEGGNEGKPVEKEKSTVEEVVD